MGVVVVAQRSRFRSGGGVVAKQGQREREREIFECIWTLDFFHTHPKKKEKKRKEKKRKVNGILKFWSIRLYCFLLFFL